MVDPTEEEQFELEGLEISINAELRHAFETCEEVPEHLDYANLLGTFRSALDLLEAHHEEYPAYLPRSRRLIRDIMRNTFLLAEVDKHAQGASMYSILFDIQRSMYVRKEQELASRR